MQRPTCCGDGLLSPQTLVILIAPNVTEQMGGEGIKALQIFQELKKLHPNSFQITHARNRRELIDRLSLADVAFVEDTWVDKALRRNLALRWFLDAWFGYKAVNLAERIAKDRGARGRDVILWQTEPNSPVMPRVLSKPHINCFGPINGNIYYPPIFRASERPMPKLRRLLHMPIQRFNRFFFRGFPRADVILCAGGERTRNSLLAAGCPPEILLDTVDCGVKDEMLKLPRVAQVGENLRFIYFGSLVFHKCTSLIIQALAKTHHRIMLDIVGRGPELDRCQALATSLDVEERVRFLGWYTAHEDLFTSFKDYRGFVFPSIEDANGIVVQEAMALGLPAICLDWGGPQLSVKHGETGYLVEPKSIEHIIDSIAHYMDTLAMDGALAERMSVASRQTAEDWRWSRVMATWYRTLANLR